MFRELIGQAIKEKRMLLTRDAKLLRYEYLIKNQIYRVKSLLKNEQLREVCMHLVIIESGLICLPFEVCLLEKCLTIINDKNIKKSYNHASATNG